MEHASSTKRRDGRIRLAAAMVFSAAALSGVSGCGPAQSKDQATKPAPKVSVAAALSREVTDYDEFTGRFEAVQRVELRPRVSGYIDDVRFTEGREVKKGETLFLIDARPYRVELQRAEAELARVQAQETLARSESERAEKLLNSRAISHEEHDRRTSQHSQSQAELRAAQAAVAAARLNLEFTRVTAPIAGRVSRAAVTAGNYVTAGQTVLTSLVSLDPIYVSFDGDERRHLRYITQPAGERTVYVGLANEAGFPHAGKLNFIDNAIDPATGTIRTRAVLENDERRFTPGLFARVRVSDGEHYQATLVPESAIGTDQDRRYVLVVTADNVVEYRGVELGGAQEGLRIVRSGLKPGERIVVAGLQRARPGTKVTPQQATAAAEESKPQG